ncbi:hypothetical protein GCM10007874_31230 [Labrys miyagiensis]|uniref:Transposase n=2 Tax=Labrys miyagiensis TaxID=346912 RepID=A0ABQ6CPF8_9HYPH|nr:hypothetical protein GCM10007874_31230 [Labrys miyagiensis]
MTPGEIDQNRLLAVVMQCLDAADHDLQRALEVAAAEILALRTCASAGQRRLRPWIETTPPEPMTVTINQVPALQWRAESSSTDFDTKGIDE